MAMVTAPEVIRMKPISALSKHSTVIPTTPTQQPTASRATAKVFVSFILTPLFCIRFRNFEYELFVNWIPSYTKNLSVSSVWS